MGYITGSIKNGWTNIAESGSRPDLRPWPDNEYTYASEYNKWRVYTPARNTKDCCKADLDPSIVKRHGDHGEFIIRK